MCEFAHDRKTLLKINKLTNILWTKIKQQWPKYWAHDKLDTCVYFYWSNAIFFRGLIQYTWIWVFKKLKAIEVVPRTMGRS